MKSRHLLLFSVLFATVMPIFSASTDKIHSHNEVLIQGITNKYLLNNINLYLDTIEPEVKDFSEDHILSINYALKQALNPYGYYHFTVTSKIIHNNNKPRYLLSIKLNEPIRIQEVNVNFTGQGADDFKKVTAELITKPHDILRHYKYEKFKDKIDEHSIENGYFAGSYKASSLIVNPYLRQGAWDINYNTGDRYKFNKVSYLNSHIQSKYLDNLLELKPGDYYSYDAIDKSTDNLSQTNWFSSNLFTTIPDHKNKTIELQINTIPRKKNKISLSLGYDSDVKARAGIKWDKPWINSRGHSISTKLFISKPSQTFGITYHIPLSKNALKYYYDINLNYDYDITKQRPFYDYKAYNASIIRYWKPDKKWQFGLGLENSRVQYYYNNKLNRINVVYTSLMLSRTINYNTDNLSLESGHSESLIVNLGHRNLLSQVSFAKFRFSFNYLFRLNKYHSFLYRLNLGYINTKDLSKLPPNFRFYAGGDRSIRGYSYNSISEKDSNGYAVGAKRLFTTSLEYQYNVYGDFWGTAFLDMGKAANNFKNIKMSYGVGVGVIWSSPVGSVKFNLGFPYTKKRIQFKKPHYYLSIGTEL